VQLVRCQLQQVGESRRFDIFNESANGAFTQRCQGWFSPSARECCVRKVVFDTAPVPTESAAVSEHRTVLTSYAVDDDDDDGSFT
jgi:hypothetical protein